MRTKSPFNTQVRVVKPAPRTFTIPTGIGEGDRSEFMASAP